jgi:putative GTP pyrophosphokinase
MADFYGDNLFILQSALNEMLAKIDLIRNYQKMKGFRDPIEHCKGRIKSEDSMLEKLQRRGLEKTIENAFTIIHDAIGIRIVCSFVDDVYVLAKLIREMPDWEILEEKDYIASPKHSGYRSYHIILCLKINMPGESRILHAEIQIRTIAQDSWAALEHELHYKHNIDHVELIQNELRRCADEMASTDLTLQTVRQMINGEI